MGKRETYEETVAQWSTEERVGKARKLVRALTDKIQVAISLHAANEIIQYSDTLSGQIPKSYAANAFTVFQDAQFHFEIIALVSVWDKAARNSISIPTVVALIDDDDVLARLAKATFDAHNQQPVRLVEKTRGTEEKKIIEELVASHQFEFANSQSERALTELKESLNSAKGVVLENQMKSVRNLRDMVAHSLTQTRAAERGRINPMKYGDERELLTTTIQLIESLYCWVNGTSFDISGQVFDIARRDARELWQNCEFTIIQQRSRT